MEKFIQSLPKPVLAISAIFIGIIAIVLMKPLHTVCDTQEASMREAQKGSLFPTKFKKNIIPPVLVRAKEACQMGNSPGSCYEYFTTLKKVAEDVSKASNQCTAQLFNVSEVKAALTDGLELMVRLAWGIKPPEPTFDRFGWMQEAELAIFCRIRRVYVKANGEDAWVNFRKVISNKLPGEEVLPGSDPSQVALETKSAVQTLTEQEIWDRSLFSMRCETFN